MTTNGIVPSSTNSFIDDGLASFLVNTFALLSVLNTVRVKYFEKTYVGVESASGDVSTWISDKRDYRTWDNAICCL